MKLMQRILELDFIQVANPPEIESCDAYRDADQFKTTIEPLADADYEWIWEYAKSNYDLSLKTFRDLDDKANDIIKYLGGGVGLFTLGALASIPSQNVWLVNWTIPSFLMSLASISFAALARQPNPTKLPPSIRGAFDYATHYKEAKLARAAFLGQWHLACTGMDIALGVKADRVHIATWCFVLTIAGLALPIVRAASLFW